MSTDKAKEQLAFVKSDLEKVSTNPNIDWIIPFFHRMMYYEEHESCSIVQEHDQNLVDLYHPLFEKYGVHLYFKHIVIHMRELIHLEQMLKTVKIR
jgi:hypothetical protein